MKRAVTIVASIAAFVLIGGLIVVWAVYQKNEVVKKSSLVKDFTDANFESDVVVASTKMPILVDFYADWCMPCRMLEPIIEQVAGDVKDKAVIGRLDTDKNMISRRLGINKIPAVWIIRDGQVKKSFYGVVPKETILEALREQGS
jgi:thioredoxin 1